MGGAYSEGGAYWKEGAKSNHYGNRIVNENKSYSGRTDRYLERLSSK